MTNYEYYKDQFLEVFDYEDLSEFELTQKCFTIEEDKVLGNCDCNNCMFYKKCHNCSWLQAYWSITPYVGDSK